MDLIKDVLLILFGAIANQVIAFTFNKRRKKIQKKNHPVYARKSKGGSSKL